MKTRFKHNIQGFTGKLDGLVYCYHKQSNEIYARKFTKAERNPSAERLKLVMANLKLINPSPGYRQNFKDYLIQYNKLSSNQGKAIVNWASIYIKMLYAMAKADPAIDLATLSREQIYDQNLPCITVKAAIEAGLIPRVRDTNKYTNPI